MKKEMRLVPMRKTPGREWVSRGLGMEAAETAEEAHLSNALWPVRCSGNTPGPRTKRRNTKRRKRK